MFRLLLLVALFSLACGPRAGLDMTTSSALTKPVCPNLDSQLDQLARSSEPEAFAARSGLVLSGERVRVIVESSGASDLGEFSFAEEAHYADRAQGYVPIARLCALSSAPGVRSVRPIERPEPASGPSRP